MDGDLSAAFHGGVAMINDFAFFLQFLDVLVKSQFGDGADGRGAHFQRYPLARFRHVKFLRLQVRVETALRFAVGVGDVVAGYRLFTRQITYF